MNRKTWLILGIITFFAGVVAVSAYQQYTLTETATIEGLGALIEIKGQDSLDWIVLKETDTIDWSIVEPDNAYVYDIKISNVGTVVFTVSLTTEVDTKYTGWTEILSMEGVSIGLTMVETGTLTLSVPIDATPQDYEWTSGIVCTELGE